MTENNEEILEELLKCYDKIFDIIEQEQDKEFKEHGYITDWRETTPTWLYEEQE